MEGRRAQFVDEVARRRGRAPRAAAEPSSTQAIDRWVWYAGWTDKLAQVLGGLNPVAGPYFDISAPEPTGVVAVLAPQAVLAARAGLGRSPRSIVTGNTAVVAGQRAAPAAGHHARPRCWPPPTCPGGVVNILTGRTAEVAPWLASHRDVNAIDLAGAAGAEGVAWGDLELAAADNLKRVLRPAGEGADAVEPDWTATPDLSRIRAFLETKTVWHPKGR